jgi:hypothetical protein
VLFGEWLLCTHGVSYDNLGSFFLAFDVFDKTEKKFLSHKKMQELLANVVECVPVLSTKWSGSLKELEGFVTKSKYSTKETAEGVYIRFESDDFVEQRLKYRRKTFKAGREDFHTNIVYNTLKK